MAIVNVLAKSAKSISWDDLFLQYTKLNIEIPEIEIFPIPKSLGFEEDCIGLSVQKGYLSKEHLIIEFKRVIELLIRFDMRLFELYDGNEVSLENITIIEKLLI